MEQSVRLKRRNIALHCSSHNQIGEVTHAPIIVSHASTLTLASSAGAIAAVLALAGAAWTGEGPKNDEVFTLNRAVPIPGNALVSFDISWFDADPSLNKYYLADRSNKAVDVILSGSSTVTHQFTPGFVGARSTCVDKAQRRQRILASCAAQRHRVRAPKYVRATMTFPDPTGCSPSTTKSFGSEMATAGSGSWTRPRERWRRPQAHQIPFHPTGTNTKEPMSSATIQLIIW